MLASTETTPDVSDLLSTITLLHPDKAYPVLWEPSRGDCGPGLVVAIMSLICKMYPIDFKTFQCPRYPSDVRARLAYLLIRDLHLSAEGLPDDDWQPLFVQDPDEAWSIGQLPPHVLSPRQSETPYNHRARIAEYVAYGEDSSRRPPQQGVFWFTTQIIERLLRHYIEDLFNHRPGVPIDGWLHSLHADKAHIAIGPICIACLESRYDEKILSPTTEWMYEKYFQIIGIATGTHFLTYLNLAHILVPGMTVQYPFQFLDWCRTIFDRGLVVQNDPRRDATAQELIHLARGRTREPYSHTLSEMCNRFPLIYDFPYWDTMLHPFVFCCDVVSSL